MDCRTFLLESWLDLLYTLTSLSLSALICRTGEQHRSPGLLEEWGETVGGWESAWREAGCGTAREGHGSSGWSPMS